MVAQNIATVQPQLVRDQLDMKYSVNQEEDFNVFWVGWAECDIGSKRSAAGSEPSTLNKNPTKCDRGDIRSYRDCVGVKEGSLADFSVDYILRKYCRIDVEEEWFKNNTIASLDAVPSAKLSTSPVQSSTNEPTNAIASFRVTGLGLNLVPRRHSQGIDLLCF